MKYACRLLAMLMVLVLMAGCAGAAAEADANARENWTNILLMGDDSRDREDHVRTDCMMILSVNRELGQVKLTSIMRDTWVAIPGHGNNKINAAQVFGGPELAVKTVNENFGMNIEQYILVNMGGLVEIVDLMGGVDVEISASERKIANQYARDYLAEARNVEAYQGETSISGEGLVHLNGLMAMSFCRDRYTDSDFGRVMRQQKLLLAMADKAQNMDVDEILDIAAQMKNSVITNMSDDQMKNLAMGLLAIPVEDASQYRLPADGAYKSGTFSGTWMIKADLPQNAQLLDAFIYGE